MSDSKSVQSGGFGIFTVLFLIFLVLKLTNTIAWSWWLVTAPLWLPSGIFLVIMLIIFLIALIVAAITD